MIRAEAVFPALLLAVLSSGQAQAYTDFSACALLKGVRTTSRLANIPPPILKQMPGLGAADGPILTDAFDPNDPKNAAIPRTRLAGAFARQELWAVVYETGGFANTRMVAVFALARDGRNARLLGTHSGPQEGGYCAILKAVFSK